jgi:hypothetical protein
MTQGFTGQTPKVVRTIVLVVPGDPAEGTMVSIQYCSPVAGTIQAVRSTCRGAPSSTYTYDIMKNGSTIYTTPANRPTRTAANSTGLVTHTMPDQAAFVAQDLFRIDLITKGADISDTTFFIEFTT